MTHFCQKPKAKSRRFAPAILLCAAAFATALPIKAADTLSVTLFRHVGPLAVRQPVRIDSTGMDGKAFDRKQLLQTAVRLEAVNEATPTELQVLTAPEGQDCIYLLSFSLSNTTFAKPVITVDGLANHELYIDGKRAQSGQATALLPAVHQVVIKALVESGHTDSIQVKVIADAVECADPTAPGRYTLDHVLHARRYNRIALSPNGAYVIVGTAQTQPGGKTTYVTEVRDVRTGQVLDRRDGVRWMPRTNRYYFVRTNAQGERELVTVEPQTHAETVIAAQLPEGEFTVSPNERQLIFTIHDEGRKEQNADVFEVTHPDDRQPGWRDRSHLAIYDLTSGLLQPLTFGHTGTGLADISQDGRHALVITSESRLTARPTTLMSLYRIDLTTLAVDTLVSRDGFMAGATFSPDGRQVLLSGSPEAFGGIGKNVSEGQTPSMIDTQLYLMDIATRQIRPLTRDFDPNVQGATWNPYDDLIYFRAEDKDCIHLFCLNPTSGRIQRIDTPEEMVMRFDLATAAPVLTFYGQSASNSDRLYVLDIKKTKKAQESRSTRALTNVNCETVNCPFVKLEDLSAQNLKGVQLGDCQPYTYINADGDSVCCRYYLPPAFDATRQYPMIVNYYGGCSPTSRNFESRYPQHAYAALGYVVLVVNPRGATGFGQKWSAAHVNTAGEGVAEDIIGAVKSFCNSHPYVNAKKIGCIGASYGGFMTQYLQTKTDLFAAAISHAGISDHTSYWGEGFWGYSYSEVSMANSYPWTDRKLYVDQSPLFNADKIHTPLLFLHGTNDNNVPVGESIQMYTALKLLGRPTAMVLVKGEDHHILAYDKRIRWQNTIFAWFARYLQDDPSWWNEMYP